MAPSATTKHHILAVPLPAQGHINPMMRFCRQLAREGVRVTFVHVDLVHDMLQGLKPAKAMAEEEEEEEELLPIRTTRVPVEGLDLSRGFAVSCEDFFEAQTSIAPHLRSLLLRLQPPVTCILSDVCMTAPTQALADSLQLARIALYPSSPSCLLFYSYLIHGPHQLSSEDVIEAASRRLKKKSRLEEEEVFASGLEGLPSRFTIADLPHFQHVTDDTQYMISLLVRETKESFEKAHSIVVNSFHELEGPALDTLSTRLQLPVHAIGPLVEPLTEDSTTSLWKEDDACILWLEQQPSLSVLYISFGSVTLLSHAQFQEILDGILSSGHSFLWVMRPGLVSDSSSPIELEELTTKAGGRGHFVGWAPQVQVLSHPSIGGFLTHCGWNSVVEAVSRGVPMLCWPYWADQFFDAKYVTEVWKTGLKFQRDEGSGLVTKDEIERVTKTLMQSEEGKVLRDTATRLKEASRNTILPRGESHNHLQALLASLPSSTCTCTIKTSMP